MADRVMLELTMRVDAHTVNGNIDLGHHDCFMKIVTNQDNIATASNSIISVLFDTIDIVREFGEGGSL